MHGIRTFLGTTFGKVIGVLAIIVVGLIIWGIVDWASGSGSSASPTPATSTTTASTTPASTTTTTSSTPSAAPATSTTTTGGSTSTTPTITVGGAATSTATTSTTGSPASATPSVCQSTTQAPDAHGLVGIFDLTGPVTDGGTVPFTLTLCKVSGDPIPYPGVSINWSWDGEPASNFASLNLQPQVYRFWNTDASRPVFQLPALNVGDSYPITGSITVPDRHGQQAVSFCLASLTMSISLQPAQEADGSPIPSWTESAGMPSSCQPYTVVR